MGVLWIFRYFSDFCRIEFIQLFFIVLWKVLLTFFPFLKKQACLSLRDKRILITGASRGVGQELIVQFAKHKPSKIIIVSRSNTILESTCRRMNREFPDIKFHFYSCDLGKKEDIDNLSTNMKLQIGFPHIIVCNAGIVTGGRLTYEIGDEEFYHTMKVNTLSHFYIVKSFLEDMVQSNEECQIVQVLSLLSFFSLPRLSAYSCSKAASYMFSDALRGEIERMSSKIGITTIHPYLIDTAMFSSARLKYPYLMAPLKTLYVAQEIVKATVNRSHCVILPKIMTLLPAIKSIVPTGAWLKLMSIGDPLRFAASLPDR